MGIHIFEITEKAGAKPAAASVAVHPCCRTYRFNFANASAIAELVGTHSLRCGLRPAVRSRLRFFQLGQNVQNGRQSEVFVGEVGRFDLLHALAVNCLNMKFLVFL
ncbi:Uncharacterised protein [Neisseria gonorrhoeae]|nr:Uncharacterised protein [Neisseria gonorrhoeae]CNQ61485.1 Uncharacterised protein [Neisseria gonorrhoeae]CNQ75604.1 Uncharacterised protein [Neisseria gonorrhoeae]CNQ90143.1 Uncharacterised protein [Neisseria gonorrhoeae]CNR99574.1 Uncharacterised protein [Neisseria gonorrhoeae]